METGSFDLEIKQRDFDRRRMFTDALQEKEGIHGWFASAEDGSIYMDEFDSTVADAAFDSLL